MSKIYALIGALASILMLDNAAWATPVGLTSAGPVGSPFSKAEKLSTISLLDTDLGRSDVVYLGKATRQMSKLNGQLFGKHRAFGGEGVALDELAYAGGTGGTWTFDPGKSNFDVAAIVIVARGHAYLYLTDTFSNTGFWDIDDFAGVLPKNLLHHSGTPRIYFFGVDPPQDVPEPLSLALLGGGLLALIMLGRRRRIAS